MNRWCAIDRNGRKLLEPIGDTPEELIEAFCALSEMSREQFEMDYTVGLAPIVH